VPDTFTGLPHFNASPIRASGDSGVIVLPVLAALVIVAVIFLAAAEGGKMFNSLGARARIANELTNLSTAIRMFYHDRAACSPSLLAAGGFGTTIPGLSAAGFTPRVLYPSVGGALGAPMLAIGSPPPFKDGAFAITGLAFSKIRLLSALTMFQAGNPMPIANAHAPATDTTTYIANFTLSASDGSPFSSPSSLAMAFYFMTDGAAGPAGPNITNCVATTWAVPEALGVDPATIEDQLCTVKSQPTPPVTPPQVFYYQPAGHTCWSPSP
jgi:hypothetical protein